MSAPRLITLVGLVALPLFSQAPTFQTSVSNLRVEVLVTRNDQPVEGLRAEDFVVRDEGEVCPIVSFASQNLPLDLVLLTDQSGSMMYELRRMERDALHAIDQMHAGDRVAVLSYATAVRLEQPFTDDKSALAKTLKRLSHDPRPEINYASRGILTAVNLLAKVKDGGPESPRRKAILIITDNLPTELVPDEDILREMSRVDVIFSGIVVPAGGWRTPPVPRDQPDQHYYEFANVFHLAKVNGGDAFLSKGKTIPEMLARMRQRNTIWCKPAATPPVRTFRRLSVELSEDAQRRYPEAEIRAPEGYYARGQ